MMIPLADRDWGDVSCSVSSGVFAGRVAQAEADRQRYDYAAMSRDFLDDAWIPCPPWRAESAPGQIAAWFGALEDLAPSLVPLPRIVWAAFAGLRAALAQTRDIESARHLAGAETWRTPIAGAARMILAAFPGCGIGERAFAICVNPPDLPTVTFNHARQGFIGLHLDSWYRPASGPYRPCERAAAAGRISINLGAQTRYLLLVPLRLEAMRDALPRGDGVTEVARHYLRRFPATPVVKMAVPPGAAYIARTEAIVHDASTEGMSSWDITLVARGYFNLGRGTA